MGLPESNRKARLGRKRLERENQEFRRTVRAIELVLDTPSSLALNAIRVESGDHATALSEPLLEVNRRAGALPSTVRFKRKISSWVTGRLGRGGRRWRGGK